MAEIYGGDLRGSLEDWIGKEELGNRNKSVLWGRPHSLQTRPLTWGAPALPAHPHTHVLSACDLSIDW